jgi:hypothetical protein
MMYQRLPDEAGELDTSRPPIPSAPDIDVHDTAGYQQAFLRLIKANQPHKVVDLIGRVSGADWNFLYEGVGLSPLSCLVSPGQSNLDQGSVMTVIDALVQAGASLTFGNGSSSHPTCLQHAAFIAASFGQDQVLKHMLDLGYPINQESGPTENSSSYFVTLLHAAASCHSISTMDLLLRRGIRCSTTD